MILGWMRPCLPAAQTAHTRVWVNAACTALSLRTRLLQYAPACLLPRARIDTRRLDADSVRARLPAATACYCCLLHTCRLHTLPACPRLRGFRKWQMAKRSGRCVVVIDEME
jgi:hypothetical protein